MDIFLLLNILLASGTYIDAYQCIDGHTWRKDCNDCICQKGKSFCTNKACNPTLTVTPIAFTKGTSATPTAPISELDMWNAASNGNLAQVNNALASGTIVNWKNPAKNGLTALNAVAKYNHPAVAKVLLDARADKSIQDNQGWDPLSTATWYGNNDVVTMLISYGVDIDIKEEDDGTTPLYTAAQLGRLGIAELLIDAHASVKTVSKTEGWTPLHTAARWNRLAIARLMLQKGADPRIQDNEGKTPGDLARSVGYNQLANIIDDIKGAPIPLIDLRTATTYAAPISQLDMWNAARYGNLTHVNNALASGTVVNWRNLGNNGQTALHAAAESNHPTVVSALLKAGAEKDLQNNGWTPIFTATWHGSTDVVTTLISYNADVDIADQDGGATPLFVAAQLGRLSIAKSLIDANANVRYGTKNGGWTPLHSAAKWNRLAIARLMLQKGADARKRTGDGKTAGDVAREQGYHQLANIIDGFTGTTDKAPQTTSPSGENIQDEPTACDDDTVTRTVSQIVATVIAVAICNPGFVSDRYNNRCVERYTNVYSP